MSDGLFEVVPDSVECMIAGERFWLAPWSLADDSEFEQRVVAKKRRPLDVAREFCAGQSEETQKHLLGLAFAAECGGLPATPDEINAYGRSREGQVVELWLRLAKNHKNLTLADAERLFRIRTLEIEAAIRKAHEQSQEESRDNQTILAPELGTASGDSNGEEFTAHSSSAASIAAQSES